MLTIELFSKKLIDNFENLVILYLEKRGKVSVLCFSIPGGL
jgi:hypothetical protein